MTSKKKKIDNLYGVNIVASDAVPEDTFYASNGVEMVETWSKSGELLDVKLQHPDGMPIPTPQFISEYKARINSFGKPFEWFDPDGKEENG